MQRQFNGWERLESALWETANVRLVDGRSAVLIDPGVTADEVADIAAATTDAGVAVAAILITHVHADHTSGIGAFPDAEVSMGPLAAAAIADGSVLRS